jgi:hypothetical protein
VRVRVQRVLVEIGPLPHIPNPPQHQSRVPQSPYARRAMRWWHAVLQVRSELGVPDTFLLPVYHENDTVRGSAGVNVCATN